MTSHSETGFYGTDSETYFVNTHGVVWIVQSVDFATDEQIERIAEVPAGAVPLDLAVVDECALDLPAYVYETATKATQEGGQSVTSTTDINIEVTLRTAAKIRLWVDAENGAPDFWNSVDTLAPPDPDAALLRDMELGTPLEVSPEQARRILTWARTLPEWDADDAPQYARHPILVQDAEED